MSRFLLVFVLLLSANFPSRTQAQDQRSVQALPASWTARNLLDACSATSDVALTFFCLGYVNGASDMIRAMIEVFTTSEDYCPPQDGVAMPEAVQIVVDWLENRTVRELEEMTPRLAVFASMMQRYRCDADQPSDRPRMPTSIAPHPSRGRASDSH